MGSQHKFALAAVALVSLAACARTPEGLKTLDAFEFKAQIAAGKSLVLDVRTEAEHAQARIKTAQTLIPVQDLEARLDELKQPKDQPVLVYCRSGNRSSKAAAMLLKAGFTDVSHLAGGIGAWKAKGLEIEP